MGEAYVIKFKNGGYLGRGHAQGVCLYMADFYPTFEAAENNRIGRLDIWDEMKTATTVKVVTVE